VIVVGHAAVDLGADRRSKAEQSAEIAGIKQMVFRTEQSPQVIGARLASDRAEQRCKRALIGQGPSFALRGRCNAIAIEVRYRLCLERPCVLAGGEVNHGRTPLLKRPIV
jgi:hypothetical protein